MFDKSHADTFRRNGYILARSLFSKKVNSFDFEFSFDYIFTTLILSSLETGCHSERSTVLLLT